MEFVDLAWIALIVFYFLLRSLGGNKRKRQAGSPQPSGSRRRPAPEDADNELDTALDEIRRALGFPDEAPGEVAQGDLADRRDPAPDPHPVQRPGQKPRQPGPDVRSDKPKPTRRRSERSTPARRPQTTGRARSAPGKVAGLPGGSQPVVGDAIVPELPALHASFSEEEAFEKFGRHPHRKTRHDLRVINPYEAPRMKKLPDVLRTLGKRSSLREAVLVKEILDRPVSMRRR